MSEATARPHADHVLRVAGQGSAVVSTDMHVSRAVNISWRRCLDDFKLDPAREYEPTILMVGEEKCLAADLFSDASIYRDILAMVVASWRSITTK